MAVFKKWKGFELEVEGCLLNQVIDLSSNMGIAYERCVGLYKDFHAHDRPMLICPRGNCQMEVQTRCPSKTYQISSNDILYLPKNLIHNDKGLSSVYDTFALYPSLEFLSQVMQLFGRSKQELRALNSKCVKLRRTQWLDSLIQEYFYRRIIDQVNTVEFYFFEFQIMIEVIKLLFPANGKSKNIDQAFNYKEQIPSFTRAIKYIESNLFSPISLKMICQHSFVSTSSLLRIFKKELKMTPMTYIVKRRLEEAKNLLVSNKDLSISEVGLIVGYENFSSFSFAFKKNYGHPPSYYKRRA